MEKNKRPTTGELYLQALDEYPAEAEEIRRYIHKDYEKHIYECISQGKKAFDGDFFIHVETKREKLTPNVIRNYFAARKTCSTPWYDQTLYKYHRNDEHIEFLWVVPSKPTCIELRENALLVQDDFKELLQFVLDYYDGTLLKRCRELNGEDDLLPLKEPYGRRT